MNIKELFDLKNKVAIVTGGYGHLGKAISEGLAESGAKVIITGRSEEKCRRCISDIKNNQKLELDYEVIDVGNTTSIENGFRKIQEKAGKIDILVNNAYFGSAGDIESLSYSNWQLGIEGTINSVFWCTQNIIPYFKNGGNIVNIASIYGIVSPDPSIYGESGLDNPPSYSVGKAAIIQFTRYAACHLASKKIRVNCISPGAFPNIKVQENKWFITNLAKKNPLGRFGKPDELKGIIVFLASESSSYVTGQNICVDGGWTSW